jgi:6-phosphogluconolactonase
MHTLPAACSVVIAAAVLAGSAGDLGAPVPTDRTIAYVSSADSREIHVVALDETRGSWAVVDTTVAAGRVMPLAISPDRRFLYAALRTEPYAVSTFAIHPDTGRLTLVRTAPLADNMAYISTDRRGRYLFGASYSGNKVSVNAIDDMGAAVAPPVAVLATGKNAHAILPDLSNRFVFVTNLGDDVILQYRFDETNGALVPNDPPAVRAPGGAGPRHFVFHTNGVLVFCLNELDATVSAYRLHGEGTLTLLATHPVLPDRFTGKPWAADVHITPDGRFLYTSERSSSTLAAFRIGDEGSLSLIGRYDTEQQPRGFNVDPKGRYLLAVGEKSNRLTAYAIDAATGALRPISHVPVGRDPNWVEIIDLPSARSDR